MGKRDDNLIRRCAPPSPKGEGFGGAAPSGALRDEGTVTSSGPAGHLPLKGKALTWEIVDGLRSVYRAIREDRGLAMSANAAYREKQLGYLRDAIEYLTDLIRSDDDGR